MVARTTDVAETVLSWSSHVAGSKAHSPPQFRSVLALSLMDVVELTPEIIEEICDQLKTFLVAGHDTTST